MSNQPGPDDRTQDELLHDLRNGPPQAQKEALTRLASVGHAEALDAVVDYLRSPVVDHAAAGLNTLRVLAHKYLPAERYSLAEALLPFLYSDQWMERLAAVRLLNTYPNELAIEALRTLVDEAREMLYYEQPNLPKRQAVLERTLSEGIIALANSGRLLVLPDILEMLEDNALRPVATRALGVIGSETERLHLEDLIEDRDPDVRDAAQWALHLMDERAEQFMNPPKEPPTPPPDRLHPIYWAHRQLEASADGMLQFLVVRFGIEHLILDQFISDGRIPEECTLVVRCYTGDTPPDHKENDSDIIGIWQYKWQGPTLHRRAIPPSSPERSMPAGVRPRKPRGLPGRGALITISYPEDLPYDKQGLISCDCQFKPFQGQGWVYRVMRRNGDWTFIRQQRTWST